MGGQRHWSRGHSITTWAGVGLGVLVVVVVVLSVVALNRNRPVAGAGATPPDTAPVAATEDVASEAPTDVVPTVVANRVLTAADANEAVRAAVTACPEPTTVEVTSDGGASWEAFVAPGIASAQRITIGDEAFIGVIGLAVEGCTPTFERSFVGGAAWETAAEEVGSAWYVDPADRAVVHSPSGAHPAPCATVVQLAVGGDTLAAVLCDDGSVHATVDGAGSWLPPVAVPGAAAIAAGGAGYRVAVLNEGDCAGAQLVEIALTDAGLDAGAPGACLATTVAAGGAAVATGESGTTWLWAGDALGRTDDGGATWQ
ncbi:hypothetical protein [Agromyces sp. NPDC056965]|uniref:hypothetical protein n=1 Tax=Agromyces sp. NPDC056965 TaxID=3345983 RepID=UPI003636C006